MKTFNLMPALLAALLCAAGCKKIRHNDDIVSAVQQKTIPDNFFKEGPLPGISKATNAGNTMSDLSGSSYDNGDDPIILGNQLVNPYSVSNMQQAYNTLYGYHFTIAANNLYVSFKPANADQLATLEDSADIELQDYPMDYELLQDGDYYQDPGLGTEEIPWLYSVVPAGYMPPTGIQYRVIQQLYIPADNLDLEAMAESLVAGATYGTTVTGEDRMVTRTDISNGPTLTEKYIEACHVDPDTGNSSCPGGGTNPPPVTDDPNIPKGHIAVQDLLSCTVAPVNMPVRQARIVCKRWFKIWRGYTDDNGNFTAAKRFRNKVKVNLKTKNGFASISKVRGIRFWQMLFPVKKRLGVFERGDMANINFCFLRPADGNAGNKELPYWVAATTQNSVIEFREYAQQLGLHMPPDHLKILISNWGGGASATGATLMLNKCNGQLSTQVAEFFIAQAGLLASGITELVTVLAHRVDIFLDYRAPYPDYNCRLNSPWIKELAYHEIGHSIHYAQAGCGYWQQYRGAVANELTKTNLSAYHPYGNGTDANNAPVIAVSEMWGNYCEYVFTNMRYGNRPGVSTYMQLRPYTNPTLSGLNCYLDAIEDFNPNDPHDLWRWIPAGLPYDLTDSRNEGFPVNDNAEGFTTLQLFTALQPDVRSITAFKNRLLQQNPNNHAPETTSLFTQYGY